MSRALRCFGLVAAVAATSACEASKRLEPCNIATEACQEDIYYALLRLRGDGYDPLAGIPPIRTIPVEEYERQLREAAKAREDAKNDDEEPMDDEDAGVPEEEPVVPWDFALHTLGLVTPEKTPEQAGVDSQVSNVAAFYSSATRSVTVIDHGPDQNRDEFGDTALLLHELVHALQDRELSGSFDDGTTDGSLASRALTEGEATFYQHLSQFEMNRLDAVAFDWHTGYTNDLLGGRASLRAVDAEGNLKSAGRSPYYGVRWFIYPLGARYLSDAWERGGNAAVRHAIVTQPRHMAQYMPPLDEDNEGSVRGVLDPPLACRVAAPGPTWQRPGLDRFGALMVYAFLSGAKLSDEDAWPIAAGWDDDLIYVFFEPEEELVLVLWRIRLADEEAVEQAIDLMQVNPLVRATREGRDLVLIAGNDEATTSAWAETIDCD